MSINIYVRGKFDDFFHRTCLSTMAQSTVADQLETFPFLRYSQKYSDILLWKIWRSYANCIQREDEWKQQWSIRSQILKFLLFRRTILVFIRLYEMPWRRFLWGLLMRSNHSHSEWVKREPPKLFDTNSNETSPMKWVFSRHSSTSEEYVIFPGRTSFGIFSAITCKNVKIWKFQKLSKFRQWFLPWFAGRYCSSFIKE